MKELDILFKDIIDRNLDNDQQGILEEIRSQKKERKKITGFDKLLRDLENTTQDFDESAE